MADKKIEDLISPAELKQMSLAELSSLAEQLRKKIIETVSSNGGHLASNLGTVELTLALLHHFDAYQDRVVWDVGHQSYSWKLLTGRADSFHTLRQEDGLSGFPKREESPADAFNTGHSSTSISAALGLARGMTHRGQYGRAIAIIGDGALTGGMAYEAINNIGSSDRVIVIINDNQMSIDKNVGSIAKHLGRIRVMRSYLKVKSNVEQILQHLPLIGEPGIRLIRWAKKHVRRAAVNEPSFFENLGFKYYGPIDGHDLYELDRYMRVLRQQSGPVILHVVTQKGRGYKHAENLPSLYHGVAPFEVEAGVVKVSTLHANSGFLGSCASYTQAFSQSLLRIAESDPAIVTVTAAMASGTGLAAFAQKYPDRFYDVGIAEQHAVTMACGMSAAGMKPVVAIYSSFLQRAFDQILHDAVLQKLHIVFCVDRAGIVGDDGETHQGIYDIAFLNALPGVTILSPSDYRSLYNMLSFSLHDCKGPVIIRYPRGSQHRMAADIARPLQSGRRPKPEILMTGQDLTIAAVGNMTGIAVEAALRLRQEKIHVTVIDVQCLKPLDKEIILASARKSGYLITIEETVVSGGLAQTLALEIAQRSEQVRLRVLSVGDHIVRQATQGSALKQEGLCADTIVYEVQQMLDQVKTENFQFSQEK